MKRFLVATVIFFVFAGGSYAAGLTVRAGEVFVRVACFSGSIRLDTSIDSIDSNFAQRIEMPGNDSYRCKGQDIGDGSHYEVALANYLRQKGEHTIWFLVTPHQGVYGLRWQVFTRDTRGGETVIYVNEKTQNQGEARFSVLLDVIE